MSACAHPRCGVTVDRGKLACREHWFALPITLRTAIMNAWRARNRDGIAPWAKCVAKARVFWAEQERAAAQ